MRYLRSCMTIMGIGSILLGLLLFFSVLFGYNDPIGVANRLNVNLLLMTVFLFGFIVLGGALIYASIKLPLAKRDRQPPAASE